jgi:hypothetical protein
MNPPTSVVVLLRCTVEVGIQFRNICVKTQILRNFNYNEVILKMYVILHKSCVYLVSMYDVYELSKLVGVLCFAFLREYVI